MEELMRAPKTETELRQEQIIEAALELIGTSGIYSLSIAGIAERVGIVPSALYRHFKSKDAVLDAILDLLKRRLLENVAESRNTESAALQQLKSIMMRHARMLKENRAIPLVVFSDGIYAGDPERKAKVAGIITAYLSSIQDIVKEGQHNGALRVDIAPETVSLLFLGMILPAAVLSNVSKDGFDVVAHAENAWPAFARCILPSE
jgi:AcrR family transcriptional regulator